MESNGLMSTLSAPDLFASQTGNRIKKKSRKKRELRKAEWVYCWEQVRNAVQDTAAVIDFISFACCTFWRYPT